MSEMVPECRDGIASERIDGAQPCTASAFDAQESGDAGSMGAEEIAPIRLLIADDHPMLREGVAAVISSQTDMMIVGEAKTGEEAVALFGRLKPNVVLMDLRMPGMSGLDAIAAICAQDREARILVLTTYSGDVHALKALRAGATGYMLKSSLRHDLLDAIRSISRGQRHLQPEVANDIAFRVIDGALSEREIEILQLIANGYANKEVALTLHLSEEAIKSGVKSIFGKLHVSDRTHAVTVAARRGIIEL